MATRKKKRTPAQERATKRMIAARKKQLRQKKKPAKKKAAKKKTAKKKTAGRTVKRNPAGRPIYYLQDKRSGQWWCGQNYRFDVKSKRFGTQSFNHAKMQAVWLAGKTNRPIAVVKE